MCGFKNLFYREDLIYGSPLFINEDDNDLDLVNEVAIEAEKIDHNTIDDPMLSQSYSSK